MCKDSIHLTQSKIDCPKHGIKNWMSVVNGKGDKDYFCVPCFNVSLKMGGVHNCTEDELVEVSGMNDE